VILVLILKVLYFILVSSVDGVMLICEDIGWIMKLCRCLTMCCKIYITSQWEYINDKSTSIELTVSDSCTYISSLHGSYVYSSPSGSRLKGLGTDGLLVCLPHIPACCSWRSHDLSPTFSSMEIFLSLMYSHCDIIYILQQTIKHCHSFTIESTSSPNHHIIDSS
jgi:hypothetical protein